MGLSSKLSLVLLIDDSEADNAFHALVIEEYGLAEHVHVELTAERALDYLKTRGTTPDTPPPALILLDLNIPGVDGWEFMERYHALDARHQARAVVVMLTTSSDPNDRERAQSLDLGFFSKPLSSESLDRIVQSSFPQLWQEIGFVPD